MGRGLVGGDGLIVRVGLGQVWGLGFRVRV